MTTYFAYKSPKDEIHLRTIRETEIEAICAYLCCTSPLPAAKARDQFQGARARGGRIVEIELVTKRELSNV